MKRLTRLEIGLFAAPLLVGAAFVGARKWPQIKESAHNAWQYRIYQPLSIIRGAVSQRSLRVSDVTLHGLDFSPDGKQIVGVEVTTLSRTERVRMWEVKNGKSVWMSAPEDSRKSRLLGTQILTPDVIEIGRRKQSGPRQWNSVKEKRNASNGAVLSMRPYDKKREVTWPDSLSDVPLDAKRPQRFDSQPRHPKVFTEIQVQSGQVTLEKSTDVFEVKVLAQGIREGNRGKTFTIAQFHTRTLASDATKSVRCTLSPEAIFYLFTPRFKMP